MTDMRLLRARSRARGAYIVEYVITIGALALVVATALSMVAGPALFKTFRQTQRAAAAPMP